MLQNIAIDEQLQISKREGCQFFIGARSARKSKLRQNRCSITEDNLMSIPVTVNLSDDVYQRVKRFALIANRDLSSVIADTVANSFPLTGVDSDLISPVADLTDEQVMVLTQLEMEPLQDAKLSTFLDKQQSGNLESGEPEELKSLMQVYREGLLRKATALAEAVKRGLMEPLEFRK
jgi:hypothetical protein